MKCPRCSRTFRSRAAYELSERRRAVIEDLRLTVGIVVPTVSYSVSPDKTARHKQASQEFRATGGA